MPKLDILLLRITKYYSIGPILNKEGTIKGTTKVIANINKQIGHPEDLSTLLGKFMLYFGD